MQYKKNFVLHTETKKPVVTEDLMRSTLETNNRKKDWPSAKHEMIIYYWKIGLESCSKSK